MGPAELPCETGRFPRKTCKGGWHQTALIYTLPKSFKKSGVQMNSLTKFSSFPVFMAMADSKQPVVEKVQQLPQEPWWGGGRRGEV